MHLNSFFILLLININIDKCNDILNIMKYKYNIIRIKEIFSTIFKKILDLRIFIYVLKCVSNYNVLYICIIWIFSSGSTVFISVILYFILLIYSYVKHAWQILVGTINLVQNEACKA